jgi:hypothetical protein
MRRSLSTAGATTATLRALTGGAVSTRVFAFAYPQLLQGGANR